MTRPKLFGLGIALALGAGPLAAAEDAPRIPWQDDGRVEKGAAIYAEHCAACHGEDRGGGRLGETKVPALDGSGHASHHAARRLLKVVRDGAASLPDGDPASPMTGFSDVLTEAEILSVLAYVKANWPADVREAHGGGHSH